MPPTVIAEYAGPIYSATYSGVPVYEFLVDDNQIMRRRSDDWINATHILKVADFDKPARTRILEREVQKGVHEKIQGGYGKYQGTWVPLQDGRLLAERNHVLDKLRPIFDFVHRDRDKTPPQAPKHTTAASNKPKVPKAAPVRRAPKPKPIPAPRHEEQYENISAQLNDDETPDNSTVVSESMIDEDDMIQRSQYSGSRKRKRVEPPSVTKHDHDHRMYADALLDYFMLLDGEAPYLIPNPPTPPADFEVDRPIDSQGHTALHWAAAMGQIEIVKDLMRRGASVDARNVRGETPLIRAALFANCYEKDSMPKMVHLLQNTITLPDRYGGTILHHVAYTAHSCSKTQRARHYLDVLLNKLAENTSPKEFASFINRQDRNGDTAFHVAARHSRRCVRAFQGVGAASDIPNMKGETVDQHLQIKSKLPKKSDRYLTSSSPVQPDALFTNGGELGEKSSNIMLAPPHNFQTQSARSFSESFNMFTDKAKDLLQAVETENEEKESALMDAKRLKAERDDERHVVRHQINLLAAEAEEEDLTPLRDEMARLVREAEALAEQKQHSVLHALVRAEESQVAASNHSNGVTNEDIQAKVRAARALRQEQEKRRDLTREIVRCQGDAGISERGEQLMRLVTSALGVSMQEIPSMLPEVLEELEMAKNESGYIDNLEETLE